MYYAFIDDNKLNGCGQCRNLTEGILNIEIDCEVYNNIEKYIWDGEAVVINPDYDAEQLEKAKQSKYEEANSKAFEYLESGNALFEFVQNENIYHIEATDGNIAKIGLKATALLIAQDYETTFPWNTKEDINIQINALEGKAIAEGLGDIQDKVWTVKFPAYNTQIAEAETIEEVEAIVINYSQEIEIPNIENDNIVENEV